MSAIPPWDPDEHDRAIKVERQRERAVRSKSWRQGHQGGHERGELTAEHLKRREAMDRALQRRANRNGED